MSTLVDALRQFNRKERYWLLRNAIGEKFETLDQSFLERLGKETGIKIPANAWWAMDYHFDWLVGALHLAFGVEKNNPQKISKGEITGTQEDIDLVVAFENTLILIEAKGDTPWSNSQLNSKVNKRLVSIFGENNERHSSLRLCFVLMSPKESGLLKRDDERDWPQWMIRQNTKQPMFIKMEMPDSLVRVTRWNNETNKQDANGMHWVVIK